MSFPARKTGRMATQDYILPTDKKPKKQDIVAAQKIIADISSGVYRSPAAALKELVSNAYDADATKVTISTDAPNFRTLVIEDNGTGMAIDKFLEVVTHIGGSRKRKADVCALRCGEINILDHQRIRRRVQVDHRD